MFLLIAHFDRAGTDASAPAGSAEAVRLLGEQPATRALRWGRTTEEPWRWALVAEFDTAADFRRAQSPFPVRAALIPWLGAATSTAAFEVTAAADRGAWAAPDIVVDDPGR
ncbi:hypothetical protein [Nakamurella sp.]|uniref:hypothetical protein n=1 Tax=Nakamurella sp. TaxID=1869182 RepID=UPI003B3B1BF2